MDFVDGGEEEVVWNPTIKTANIVTTIMKIILEVIFVKNIYDLQRVTFMADEEVKWPEEYPGAQSKPFTEVWFIPETVNCYLGHEPHSACAQVKIIFSINFQIILRRESQ
jgi:hypothetical protein